MTLRRLFGRIFLVTGLSLILFIAVPLLLSTLQFQLFSPKSLFDPSLASAFPLPRVINVLGLTTQDYTSPQSWFDTQDASQTEIVSSVKFYTISLPRLNIIDVPVEINGTDLKQNAIHYPGSSLPGQFGNAVVFGHSSLPQLYKPRDPLTIFNPLPKAKIGDEVQVKYDGIAYKYVVKKTLEVTPKQIEVLSQTYDRYEITLITCVPLGTYWRRFVVVAELVN